MSASDTTDAIVARLMPEMQKRMGTPGAMDAWVATLTAAEQAAITAWLSETGNHVHEVLKRIDEELS